MSGALLRYPLKPPQVCDDLESFIHLIHFFIARYHYTTLTDKKTWNLPSHSPGYNQELAKFVSDFFYYSFSAGDYSYGGNFKFSAYKDLTPPFKVQWEDGTLGWLLSRLHELCLLHYQSLDENALKKYSGREERVPRRTVDVMVFKEDSEPTTLPATTEDIFGNPRTSLVSNGPNPRAGPDLDDPLASHDQILAAFESVLKGYLLQQWEKDDRTPVDQFLNLPEFDAVFDKNNSITHSSASVSGASTGSKRGRDPQDQEGAQKKAKGSRGGSRKGSRGGSGTGSRGGSSTGSRGGTRPGLTSGSRGGSTSGSAQ